MPDAGGHRQRFRDDARLIDDFMDNVLVVCPRCGRRAVITRLSHPDSSPDSSPDTDRASRRGRSGERRLTCAACGLVQERRSSTAAVGRATDPFFGLPLALQAACAGHVIWAYNADHLDHLLRFAAATVRERSTPGDPNDAGPASLVEKLPAWMTSAKNRAHVVAALTTLQRDVT